MTLPDTSQPGASPPNAPCPRRIPRPEYVGRREPRADTHGDVYSPAEVELIRESGRIAAGAVEAVGAAIRPGVTTDELDAIAHELRRSRTTPTRRRCDYRGYPKSSCTSVNEVICHGIPDDTVLVDGDIINIDITAFKNGMHGDLNATFSSARSRQDAVDLVERTREALNRGIKAVAPGRPINVIGRAIESYAKRFGYGVVRDYTGHGVGRDVPLRAGHPALRRGARATTSRWRSAWCSRSSRCSRLGDRSSWDDWDDDWTVVTRDRSLTAQFEHTLVVTERGAEILTLP